MNKKNKLLIFLLCIVFFSCTSNSDIYTPLNYTDDDIVKNELSSISKLAEKNPVEALWRINLLKEKTQDNLELTEQINSVFNDCSSTVIQQCSDAYEKENYIEAGRLYSSLLAIKNIDLSGLSFSQNNIIEKIKKNIPISKPENSAATNKKNINMSSYISGTVTIWVDQGIQVQKGMGYASHVIGSGFFISDDGYIITNYHVIQSEVDPEYEGYSRLYIKLAKDSDTRIPARVVGWDSALDLALIKAECDVPYYFSLGSSKDLNIGDKIYAIGSPVGLENTLTSGIVSSVDRKLFTIGSVMQIDAAVNSGNSGGPIIDEKGNVQAVVFAGMLEFQGLNFAIPVEYLKSILPFLSSGGERKHGWIGAFGKNIKADEFSDRPAGVEVQYLMPGGTAIRSGINTGDIIVNLAGKTVSSLEDFQNILLQIAPDTITSISVFDKDGNKKEMPVYISERPKNPGYEIYKKDIIANAFFPIFGMKLSVVDGSRKKYTVSEVLKGSTADETGFSVYDPVQILKIQFPDEENIILAQLYTKKRKNGYFEVSIMMGSAMDSPNYF